MGRMYYTDYARHCLRFYARYPDKTEFNTEVERLDYESAEKALTQTPYRFELLQIYTGRDTFSDEVFNASVRYDFDLNELWKLTEQVEYAVAKARGLK